MRVAISVVAIALIFTSSPAPASPSCMTQSEARAKFTDLSSVVARSQSLLGRDAGPDAAFKARESTRDKAG